MSYHFASVWVSVLLLMIQNQEAIGKYIFFPKKSLVVKWFRQLIGFLQVITNYLAPQAINNVDNTSQINLSIVG